MPAIVILEGMFVLVDSRRPRWPARPDATDVMEIETALDLDGLGDDGT